MFFLIPSKTAARTPLFFIEVSQTRRSLGVTLLGLTLLSLVSCGHRADAWPSSSATTGVTAAELLPKNPDEAHAALYVQDRFPSAKQCAVCHPTHYEEWSASPHAYAQLSPIFNAMSGTILKKTNGTLGDFCIRCHTPVGMALEEPLFGSNFDRHPTSLEGVTCIGCHRVNQNFGKVSGRRALVSGSVNAKVYGPMGGEEVRRVIEDPDITVASSSEEKGRPIHNDADRFFALVEPSFCGTCHDVNLPNGFRLEEAFSDYKDSEASQQGVP